MTKVFVPENQRTTDYYLFEPRFKCSVTTIDLHTPEHIKEFGIYLTHDKEINNLILNERQLVYLTINEMTEYYKNGVTIGLVEAGTSKKIYDHIENHLKRWLRELELGLGANVGKAPIDDLVLLDEFASVIFPHAVRYFNQDEPTTGFGKYISSIFKNGRALIKPPTPETSNIEEKGVVKEDKPERVSMGDLFNSFKGTSFYSLSPLDEDEDGDHGI